MEGVEAELREHALRDMSNLEEALKRRGRHAPSAMFALDAGGGVVAVNNKEEEAPGGMSCLTITTDCPALREFIRKGVTRAR